jgi:hypothetical protein
MVEFTSIDALDSAERIIFPRWKAPPDYPRRAGQAARRRRLIEARLAYRAAVRAARVYQPVGTT